MLYVGASDRHIAQRAETVTDSLVPRRYWKARLDRAHKAAPKSRLTSSVVVGRQVQACENQPSWPHPTRFNMDRRSDGRISDQVDNPKRPLLGHSLAASPHAPAAKNKALTLSEDG